MRQTVNSSGASRGSVKSYSIGFILSVFLTIIAFAVVVNGELSRPTLLACITGLAIAQILVHLHYFLHLDSSSEARWNVLVMVYTFLILILFVGGSIWIMYSLHYRMML